MYTKRHSRYGKKQINSKSSHVSSPSDYPLYNKYYSLTKQQFFELIEQFKPEIIDYIPPDIKNKHTIVKYNSNYLLIKENWQTNEELNSVTDYFTEIVRIQCNFKHHISPFEFWTKYHSTLFPNIVNDASHIKYMRDVMYKNAKFCNNFRVSVALTILRLFQVKKWLDISAGWGDRLIAAIGHGVDLYVGVDPNNALHPLYKNIISTLVEPSKQKNFVLINDGFESANIPRHDYDIVFSSPPFFDLETYSSDSKDSLVSHPSIEDWYNNFLIASIKKAYDNLIVGGHLVLYMGDCKNIKYVDKMAQFTDTIMKSNGSIYYFYEDTNIPRRMYVWKKVSYM
jgi:hypothetical protein